jgi:hypothetical protein
MTPSNTATTGTDIETRAVNALRDGVAAIYAVLNRRSAPTPEGLFPELAASCRELADHLHAYTFAPEGREYDEDAVIAVERAERLLRRARPLLGQPEKPRGHPATPA